MEVQEARAQGSPIISSVPLAAKPSTGILVKTLEGWRKGLINHIKLTGRSKAIYDSKANGRSTNTRFEYECLDCGHVGWTRHYTVLNKAIKEGFPTPGSESQKQ